MIQVSQEGKTVKSSGVSSDGKIEQFSCAGEVARVCTGTSDWNASLWWHRTKKKKKKQQPPRLSYNFTTRTLYG